MKKIFLTSLLVITGTLVSGSLARGENVNLANDSSKMEVLDRSNLQALEYSIIENYLEEMKEKETVSLDKPEVKIVNDRKIVFEGSLEDPRARKLILKAEKLTTYQGTDCYLIIE